MSHIKNQFLYSTFNNPTFIFNTIDLKEDIEYVNFFSSNKGDSLSKYSNIEFNRKKNLLKRSKQVVDLIAKHHNETINIDASKAKNTLLKNWSGEGKTTISIEFAYKFGRNYVASFWIDSSKSIGDQFCEIAQNKFGILIPNDVGKDQIRKFQIDSIRDYIDNHSVLLIFDNVEKIEDIERFLPKKGNSRAIVVTTNFNIKNIDHLEHIEIPKLDEEDALQILLHNIEEINKDIENAKTICSIFGYSPFALELANNYLQEFPDVSLSLFYDDIKRSTIKWEGLQKVGGINFIHSTPSVISLIEKRVSKLNLSNTIDEYSKIVLSILACISLASDEYEYITIKRGIGLIDETKDNLLLFNKIKNRLTELGLVVVAEKKFIIHTLIVEYLKNYLVDPTILIGFIESKIFDTKTLIQRQLQFGIWFSDYPFPKIKNLFEFLFSIHTPKGHRELTHLISLFMFNSENLYFYGSDEECLLNIDKALELCEIDKDFQHYEVRNNDIIYRKALSLHRIEKFEEAKNIYLKLVREDSPMSSYSSLINANNYIGHIYKYNKEFQSAYEAYDNALFNCQAFFENGGLDEEEYLIEKIRTLLFLKCLYKEEGKTDKEIDTQNDIDLMTERLMSYAPDEVRNMSKTEPNKYPLEIGQLLIQGCLNKPEATALKVRRKIKRD